MALKHKRRLYGSRKKVWAGCIASVLLFLVSSVVAFPNQTWNKVSFLPHLNIADFRLGLDLQGGAHLEYEADMTNVAAADRNAALDGVRDVIERRVNAFGVSEPLVQTAVVGGHYRVIVELAGVLDVTQAIKQIGETPILEFKEENPDYVAGKANTLTADQQKQLAADNATELAAAQAVLKQAQSGTDFGTLVNSNSILTADKANGGDVKQADDVVYKDAIADIVKAKTADGQVLPKVYATNNGYEVIKLVGTDSSQNEMELSHILICWQGATACTQTRTKDDALKLAKDLITQATTSNFGDLASKNTDDSGSKSANGDLGWIRPGQTVPAFDTAAQALAVGAISTTPVESEFGYHIIYKRAQRPFTIYHIQRIVMKRTTANDIAPQDQWKNTDLSGKDLQSAKVVFDPTTNNPIVSLQFNSEGADLFGKLTGANVGKQIAIFLDGSIISAPTVNQKIDGGQAVITGNFTLSDAKLLAERLNAGALPVPVTLVSQQTIGPTLGQSSLDASIKAALIGLALVALFMILYYRLPGLLAVLALMVYVSFNLLLYKLLGVTISLSGVAGFVLSMGIALDANVLIFARLKEELAAGRDLPTAIDEGFRRAWPSIRDGNMTTLIATAILFNFSTSFIKGFALNLAIGVLTSMFSAIVITRGFVSLVAGWKWLAKPWLFGYRKRSESSAN